MRFRRSRASSASRHAGASTRRNAYRIVSLSRAARKPTGARSASTVYTQRKNGRSFRGEWPNASHSRPAELAKSNANWAASAPRQSGHRGAGRSSSIGTRTSWVGTTEPVPISNSIRETSASASTSSTPVAGRKGRSDGSRSAIAAAASRKPPPRASETHRSRPLRPVRARRRASVRSDSSARAGAPARLLALERVDVEVIDLPAAPAPERCEAEGDARRAVRDERRRGEVREEENRQRGLPRGARCEQRDGEGARLPERVGVEHLDLQRREQGAGVAGEEPEVRRRGVDAHAARRRRRPRRKRQRARVVRAADVEALVLGDHRRVAVEIPSGGTRLEAA